MFNRQIELLAAALRQPLPGSAAQRLFAPELSYGRHFAPPPADARQAAVMILLYPGVEKGDGHVAAIQTSGRNPVVAPSQSPFSTDSFLSTSGLQLPLIVRSETLEHHAGQIGLPGGLIEPGESSWEAAARELEEELGVAAAGVTPLGELTPLYIYASQHYVVPWVATMEQRPAFVASAHEVAELLEVPLAHLLDSANRGGHERNYRGARLRVPHISWGGHQIWGATAMILAELLAVIEQLP
jgi:8-oxo-dGTP pyrophosphatase MutT (NUDIX family)